MRARTCKRTVIVAIGALWLTGCATRWTPHWDEAGASRPGPRVDRLLADARAAYEGAHSREDLLEAVSASEAVLVEDPANREALTQLCSQHTLFGTAHTRGRRAKSERFRTAIKYCELAMYSNPAFRQRIDDGEKPWQATGALGAVDADAMLFWVTAVQYDFKEGMGLPAKIVNVDELKRAMAFLDRVEEVAPDYRPDAVNMARSVCYFALPKSRGGDSEAARRHMQAAIDEADGYMLARWGRGKYFHVVDHDAERTRQDLEWVIEQSLPEFRDPHAWLVHFQSDARQRLNR